MYLDSIKYTCLSYVSFNACLFVFALHFLCLFCIVFFSKQHFIQILKLRYQKKQLFRNVFLTESLPALPLSSANRTAAKEVGIVL